MAVFDTLLGLSSQKNVSVKEMSRGILYVGCESPSQRRNVMGEDKKTSLPSTPPLVYVQREDSVIFHYFPDCTRRTMTLQVEIEDGMRECERCERRKDLHSNLPFSPDSHKDVVSDGESMATGEILTLQCLERGIIYQVSIALEDGTVSCTCESSCDGDVCEHTNFILYKILGLPSSMIDDLFEYGGFDEEDEIEEFTRAVREGLEYYSERRCFACRDYLHGLTTVALCDGRSFHQDCYDRVRDHL